MAIDVMAEINGELERASQPRASRKAVFLFLGKEQKALVRPVYNLDKAIILMKHNKWHDNRDQRVNAICAKEEGNACLYCERAKEDKKLTAEKTFYVPVYVYNVTNVKTGLKVTYKDAESQEEKPVAGFRMLELTAFGRVAAILKTLNSQYRDENEHDITICDFSIEQVGEGQKKDFITLPKAPKPLDPRIKKAMPSREQFRTDIFDACPPYIVTDETSVVAEDLGELDDDIPVF